MVEGLALLLASLGWRGARAGGTLIGVHDGSRGLSVAREMSIDGETIQYVDWKVKLSYGGALIRCSIAS